MLSSLIITILLCLVGNCLINHRHQTINGETYKKLILVMIISIFLSLVRNSIGTPTCQDPSMPLRLNNASHQNEWAIMNPGGLSDPLPGLSAFNGPDKETFHFLYTHSHSTDDLSNLKTLSTWGVNQHKDISIVSGLSLNKKGKIGGFIFECTETSDGLRTCFDHNLEQCCTNSCSDSKIKIFRTSTQLKCNPRLLSPNTPLKKQDLQTLEDHHPKDLCCIDELCLKECRMPYMVEQTIPFVIIQNTFYPVSSLSLSMVEDSRNPGCYKCIGRNRDCEPNPCGTGACKGDRYYQEAFGITLQSKCHCSYKPECSKVQLQIGRDIIPVDCWGSYKSLVSKERRTEDTKPHLVVKRCETCQLECTKEGVKIVSGGLTVSHYIICANSGCLSSEITDQIGDELNIILPDRVKVAGGLITAEFWSKEGIREQLITRCSPTDECSLIDCYFCSKRMLNVNCWDNISVVLAITFTTIALFILHIIYTILTWIILTSLWLTKPFRILLRQIMKCILRKSYDLKKTYDLYADEINVGDSNSTYRVSNSDLTSGSSVTQSIPSESSKPEDRTFGTLASIKSRRNERINPQLLLLTILALLIPFSQSCAQSSFLTSNSKSCSISTGGVMTCSITNNLRMGLSPIGQDSCLILQDPDNNPIANVVINIKGVNLVCKKDTYYYTTEVEPSCISRYQCRSVADCVDNVCENTLKESDPSWPESSEMSGKIKCMRTGGCAGNGCGLCSPACLTYFQGIKSAGKGTYEVFGCPSWSYQVKVEISWVTLQETYRKVITLVPGVAEEVFGIGFTLIAISTPQQPILNDCFLNDGNERMFQAPCNKRGELTKGKIGEVQCKSRKSATMVDKDCFFDEGIISVINNIQSVTCISDSANVEAIVKENILPRRLEGLLLYNEGDQVYAQFEGNALLEMQLNMKDRKVSIKSDQNYCFARQLAIDGCYNCDSGAQLELEVNTNFGTAIGQISCPEIGVNFPVTFTHENIRRNLTLHIGIKDFDTICSINCPAGTNKMRMKGALAQKTLTEFKSQNLISTSVNNAASGFNFDSLSTLDPFGSIKKIVIMTMVISMSLFFCYLLLKVIFKQTKKCSKKRISSKIGS